MCFSAGASFVGGAVITAIGVLTVRTNRDPSRRIFAAIPLIFGVQQISEGFVWVALQSPGHDLMLSISTFIFLIAALVVWPSLIPLSVLGMEKVRSRRLALYFFLVAGILTSVYYGMNLIVNDVDPRILGHHIKYAPEYPRPLALPVFIAYLIATLAPLFISSVRNMWMFGLLVTVSCLITGIFFKEYLASVWCFFAALISAVIWVIVKREG
ncbi:MAG: DUF6629 family protein [Bacteroidales bacterium]